MTTNTTLTQAQFLPITGYGQINTGDKLSWLYIDEKGYYKIGKCKVKDVLFKGTEQEEIIVNRKKNNYFLTKKYLAGNSWVKDVKLLKV